ncbi:MAG: TIR domain-containing protein [Steroidobacteraceae bacterium]
MAEQGGMGTSFKGELLSSGASASTSSRPVFISYASHDAAVAQMVCAALEAEGIPCWIAPRDVVPGTQYADGIVGAIDESRILVLIVSKDALASAHVGRELERAASKRHPIIALRLDTAPLTRAFEYFLNQSQWIEMGAGGTDAAIAKLVEAMGRHLAAGSAVAPTQSQAPVRKAATSRRVWGVAGIVVVLALAAAYFLVGRLHFHSPANIAVADKSIAILPFVDMSEKKDQEYFADGMAEEIINLLVKIRGLKVIARTSSFQFKGQTEDLRTIGAKLGAAYVLEGSVRKSGDRLRVTAQLINSRDGKHLFSQTYDRDLNDVLKMQDEIAAKVAFALEIEVNAAEDLFSRPSLRNTDAYTLYLHGINSIERFDQQGIEQALSDFQRAFDLDPTFATGAAGISAAYDFLGEFGFMPAPVAFEQARRAAQQAIKLDPHTALGHGMLGSIHMVYDWDWAAADAEINLVRNLAPDDSTGLLLAGQQSLIVGRWNNALKLLNAALELDPLDPSVYGDLSSVQLRRGQLAEAEAAIRRTIEINSTYSKVRYKLGVVLLARNQPEAALAEFLKEPIDEARIRGSAMAYSALGRKADSDAALAQMLKSQTNHPFGIAGIYAFRGELDEAFRWLDRAYAQKDPDLPYIKGLPQFKNLEEDLRYKALLKKMNLVE